MTIIETNRLVLRHIFPEDVTALLKIYNKVENMRFISDGKVNWIREKLIEKYQRINENYSCGFGIFAIELKGENKVIGEAGLFNSFNDITKLELGYIIDSSFWNRGLGKEICSGLIDYSFNELQVKVLVARMYSDNKSSVRLSEKCGMRRVDVGIADNGSEYFVYEKNND